MKEDKTSQQYMFERVEEIVREHLTNEQEETVLRLMKNKDYLERELGERDRKEGEGAEERRREDRRKENEIRMELERIQTELDAKSNQLDKLRRESALREDSYASEREEERRVLLREVEVMKE